MIKDIPKNWDLVIDVALKNGDTFLGCDVPTKMFGEHGNCIAFWPNRDKSPAHLHVVPLENVESIILRDFHEPF